MTLRLLTTTSTVLRRAAAAFLALGLAAGSALAQQPASLQIYGPGGPAPAMKEAAKAYSALKGISIDVTAGPTPKWIDKARSDANIIYSGAENMMGDFAKAMPGLFKLQDAEPLYLRPVAILVRPGNPKGINGFEDLLRPGVKVLAVAGAGQTGLWEDVAGRTGDIEVVKAFRRNLALPEAANSAIARQMWQENAELDAWLIWNIWQVSNPTLAQQVPVEEKFRIYRDTGVVLTQKGKGSADAQGFVDFLKSSEGKKIFAKWGWETGSKN